MGIGPHTIVTLENNKKYAVLKSISYQGKKYYMTTMLDEAKNMLNNSVVILEEEIDGNNMYVKEVLDIQFRSQLLSLLGMPK